jgi:uncharacterized protein YndB with AHSA1/START domain
MPIKKDASGRRSIEMELVLPGTPEQIWEALATGAGNTAWFTRVTVEERVGGRIHFDFGPNGTSTGEVTAWEPPRLFGYVERDWSAGAPPVATEITITGRGGDRTVVRMVHSLFSTSDDWDDQLEGFEKGWPFFFDVLRVYLSHFAGQPAASFMVAANVDGDHLEVWKRLTESMGLAGANVGERVATAAEPERMSGVVERARQTRDDRFVLMRLEGPTPGIAAFATYPAGSQVTVSIGRYLYGPDAAARAGAAERQWRAWLADWSEERGAKNEERRTLSARLE